MNTSEINILIYKILYLIKITLILPECSFKQAHKGSLNNSIVANSGKKGNTS